MIQGLGRRITKIREEKGLTKYRLSKNSGISFSYLSALEEDKHSPTLEIAVKLSTALDVSVDELIGRERGERGSQ